MDAAARARIERIAMQAVFDAEHALGHRTKDVSAEKCGWVMNDNLEKIPEAIELGRATRGFPTLISEFGE